MGSNQVLKTTDFFTAERLHRAGNLAAAETGYRQVLASDPEHGEALRLLGLLAHQTGHVDQATQLISRAVKIQPENVEAHFNLGTILLDRGPTDKAVAAFQAALEIAPDNFSCLVNLGNALVANGQYHEAVQHSKKALEVEGNSVEALSNLGQALAKTGKLTEAMSVLRRAVLLRPGDGRLLNNLGIVEQALGLLESANQTYEQALIVDPKCRLAERNILINTLNLAHQLAADIFKVHQAYGQKHQRPNIDPAKFHRRNRDIHRRLRIGYLSSDFHRHPVGFNVLPLIRHHDPSEVEIFIYAENEVSDAVTAQFKTQADHWHITVGQTDAQVAGKITRDEIDILVSLAGRFNLNRPTVTSHRAAPIQISYHDCATSGLTEMDYWLTDKSLHPVDSPEKFTEQLYHLPIFYQFPPPDNFPVIAEPPVEHNGFITFGSFNKPEKINDHVIALWADVLASVPHSMLLFKYRDYFDDPALVQHWQNKFSHFGITADRLIFESGIDPRAQHLARYQNIDIALDPFPFNGATTTFEAMAMGVPVITLSGQHFVDRVAGALLRAVDLEHLVAKSPREYIKIAKNLTEDPSTLRELRQNLRQNLINSALCQGLQYAKNIEIAYREMWRRWCSK